MTEIETKEAPMHINVASDWTGITKAHVAELIRTRPRPAIGYLVWTRQSHGEREVYEYIEALTTRNITHLRTGISWAEWMQPSGREWISWYIREYAKHFTVLPCLTFTPPELASNLP